jgi:hypothetical protein
MFAVHGLRSGAVDAALSCSGHSHYVDSSVEQQISKNELQE